MFPILVWLSATLVLYASCTKKRKITQHEIPLYPLVGDVSLLTSLLSRSVRFFFFLFCCLWSSLFLESVFSFCSPSWLFTSSSPNTEKSAPYSATLFIIDRSGSMKTPADGTEIRLSFAKQCVQQLINQVDKQGERKDVVGLMACARLAPILVPMTRNRDFFLRELKKISPEEDPNLNGTALGYALFKGAFLLVALEKYAQKNELEILPRDAKSIVVITDGLEEIHPFDYSHPFRSLPFREALRQAKAFHIRVWYILIGPTPTNYFSSFAKERLLQLTESTSGGFIELVPGQNKEAALERVSKSFLSSAQEPKGMKNVFSPSLDLKLLFLLLCLSGMRFSELGRVVT